MNRFLFFPSYFWILLRLEAKKPNIVFFLVDDLGWSDVGCYGSSFYETPHIDRLAKEGVKIYFRLCCLSRLFTYPGQHSHREISSHHEPDGMA
jgi:hypothetical protein